MLWTMHFCVKTPKLIYPAKSKGRGLALIAVETKCRPQ